LAPLVQNNFHKPAPGSHHAFSSRF
jgi:hypothetical protein